jgi:hypothetical protein
VIAANSFSLAGGGGDGMIGASSRGERASGQLSAPRAVRRSWRVEPMCRNIRTLFNFDPPANDEEIRAAARQFVRKLSGFAHPSRANAAAFEAAVDEVAETARRLMASLTTQQPPRDRAVEAERARERARQRFA